MVGGRYSAWIWWFQKMPLYIVMRHGNSQRATNHTSRASMTWSPNFSKASTNWFRLTPWTFSTRPFKSGSSLIGKVPMLAIFPSGWPTPPAPLSARLKLCDLIYKSVGERRLSWATYTQFLFLVFWFCCFESFGMLFQKQRYIFTYQRVTPLRVAEKKIIY